MSTMMNPLVNLFKRQRAIGVVGDAGSGKSSCILHYLISLKQEFNMPVYVMSAEESIQDYLISNGIKILYSTEDILDMKVRDAVIYIDEFAEVFDVRIQSKQGMRIKRFFNRIEHLNNYVIISSAEVNFWNSFVCSLVQSYIVKGIEFTHLVRGTDLKRKVMAINKNTSDYRLDIGAGEYYLITPFGPVQHCTFEYDEHLDSKKGNVNPFLNRELNREMIVEVRDE